MKLMLAVLTIAVLISVLSWPAFAGCGKWVVRSPETDYLEDPVFDEAVKSSTGPSQNLIDDEKTGDDGGKANSTPQQAASAPGETASSAPDLSGTWGITLQNLTDRSLELILIQSSDRLQGYGNLILDKSQIPATATGTISEDGVMLDVKLVVDGRVNQVNQQYKLDLDPGEDRMSGTYEAYTDSGLSGKGSAVAVKS